MFVMRFDMRAPSFGASAADLYAAAVEMCAYAEGKGALQVVISEHHCSEDGYLPSPLLLASAVAARTESLPIQIAALLVPLHDPIELAEQMAVLDLMSRGRVSYVCAIGYRAEEYAMFGREMKGRGARMEESLHAMRRAWTAESFDYQGRRVRVTPAPFTDGGPPLLIGGNSKAAVRRAARLGLGMITQGGDPSLNELYAQTCAEAGTTPGLFINPEGGTVMTAFVAEDPDAAWARIGPHMLHDAQMYAAWLGAASSSTKSVAGSVEALRAEEGAYRIFTPEQAIEYIRTNGILMTQPLCGGVDPRFGWATLELLTERVMPALQAGGSN